MGQSTEPAKFTAYILNVDELEDERRRYALASDQIARINPNTKTAPIFRSRRDAELTAAIYDRIPVLFTQELNKWAVEVQLIQNFFSGSNPKDQLLFETGSILPVEERVLVYRGSMVWQYDSRAATYDFSLRTFRDSTKSEHEATDFTISSDKYVAKAALEERFCERGWNNKWVAGWRDITNATNERTVVSAILPYAASDDTYSVILPENGARDASLLTANLNSLLVDFCAQQKVGGTHIRKFTLQQFPILPSISYSEADLTFIVPRVLELTYTSHSMTPFARDLGFDGPPFAWDEDRRAHLRAELDAWYALAYGLTRDELRYVLDPKDVMGSDYPSETFRVLQKNEIAKHGEYRTRRLVLAAYDALVTGGMRPRTEGYR
jgi:hypothetical protein